MSLPIEKSSSDELVREVARRRTFAIISHPDAGKTTLTEKLLLYAGAVHARSHQRASKSDWMELEQARGISITSTALQFDYQGVRVNLLDTPGHQDFSEDTYRTLMAVKHRRPARCIIRTVGPSTPPPGTASCCRSRPDGEHESARELLRQCRG